jgi:putative nucleotidyltransferase with HDIG domain
MTEPAAAAAAPPAADNGAVSLMITLAVSAASVCLALSAAHGWHEIAKRPLVFLCFVAIAIALALASVEVYGRGTFSFSGSAILAIGLGFGLAPAMFAGVLTIAVHYVRRRGKLHRAIFTAATVALAAFAGTLLSVVVGSAAPFTLRFAAAAVAGPVYGLVNTALLAVAIGLTERRPPRAIWCEHFRWMMPYFGVSGILGLTLVLAYERVGVPGLCAFALPPAFMMISVRQYIARTRAGVEETRVANEHLRESNAELAARNDDLHRLLDFARGLASHSMDHDRLVAYAEDAVARLAGSRARIRVGSGTGGETLVLGDQQIGSLAIDDEPSFDADRWGRLREVALPQLATAIESAVLADRMRKTHLATIAALSRSMEAKDGYTGGHTERVAGLAVALAQRLGFSAAELEAIQVGALLHDIGKIGIPERILNKPGPLDDDEWAVMHTHPLVSEYILTGVDLHPIVLQIARSSHERIDGLGYPDGLAGDDVPLPARIALVADAFDALTSDRPYRPARSPRAALAEVRAHTGTQFCSVVVAVLEQVLEEDRHPAGIPQLHAVDAA